MSLTVIVEQNGKPLTRYGQCMTMEDVLQYIRGWTSPKFGLDGMTLVVQAGEESRRYDMNISAKSVTLRPQR